MTYIPPDLRAEVIRRSLGRCEYCGLSQEGQEATFHIDHIVPLSGGGETSADNLALACVSCSLRKSARVSDRDPLTGEIVPLFNPRSQTWRDHFRCEGAVITGLTPTGRATVQRLALNRTTIMEIRAEEAYRNRYPAPWQI